jgi:hypothetical protein
VDCSLREYAITVRNHGRSAGRCRVMAITTKVKRIFRRRRPFSIPREPGKGEFGDGPGGVREPRNPKGNPPADAIQIPEPR